MGRRAAASLQEGVTGRLLARFERTCDLVTDLGDVVALAFDPALLGPFIVVVAGDGPDLRGLRDLEGLQGRFAVSGRTLRLGAGGAPALTVNLSRVTTWEPLPDYAYLGAHGAEIASRLPALAQMVSVPANAVFAGDEGWQGAAQRSIAAIARSSRSSGGAALAEGVTALCGLGPGLTPAGDDWLAGWLLGLRVAQAVGGSELASGGSRAEGAGALVLGVSARRTTTLSRAFLACAAAGEADLSWHTLLGALAGRRETGSDHPAVARRGWKSEGWEAADCHERRGLTPPGCYEKCTESALGQAVQAILAHGATSGAAMLAGFVAGCAGGLDPERAS